jgi:transposase
MAMLSFGGIDVSKDRLDITVLPDEQCSSVSNDAAGWAELVEQLRGSSITAIGVEASGGYERGVVRALLAAGMSVRQINPFKLRQFAKASGTLAKNDRLDARMIASFVAVMPTRPAQRQAPMIEQLAAMLTVRRQLGEQKVATENASRLLEGAMLQRLSRRRVAGLTADIDLLDHRDRYSRSCSRPSFPAAHLHARGRRRVGLHADRALARARPDEPQTGCRSRRACAL